MKTAKLSFTILALSATSLNLYCQTPASPRHPAAAQSKVNFTEQVQPLLAAKCFSCHGDTVRQGGLRLDRRQPAMRGGDYGPVIIPGDSARSKLIRRVADGDGGLRMPPTEPLSDDEINLLRAWIDQGADYRIEVQEDRAPKALSPEVAAFFKAIRTRDDAAVAASLAANPKLVQARDLMNSTPLHLAAAFGTVATMKLLLEKGADVNASNRQKTAPVNWALHDVDRVRILVEAGADVNTRILNGNSLLNQAAILGNSNPVLKLLLAKGADPNVASANGLTPLMSAANRGDVEAMQLLLAAKAQADARNAAGGSPLLFAAGSGNPQAVELLLRNGADPKVRTKRGDTALDAAGTQGNLESVRMLVEKGAVINTQDSRGYSPLMHAAASDTIPTEVVRFLLAKGADTSLTAEYGNTAASLAAKRGDTAVARLLGASERDRLAGGVASALPNNASPVTTALAVEKALPLLAKQSYNFIRIGGCNSCHSQDITSAAASIARSKGLHAPKEIPQLTDRNNGMTPERLLNFGVVGVSGMAWELFDMGVNQLPANDFTDATLYYLRAMQTKDGHWHTSESRRPPMSSGAFQTAALSVYALQTYSREADREESALAVSRARTWLEGQTAAKTQDRAFHLMGLVWAKASPQVIERAKRALAQSRDKQGGWSQLPTMRPDAYATGQALYALHLAGMPASDPVYKQGVNYLLRTQAEDGTWHVKSRSIWLQPYFESGFPYGTDQFISTAGTAWASMALAAAADNPPAITTAARK